ncbi:MAG: superoxide dismutase family protein [Clostridia bacterium]|nr:superoxide dismutase family protein [Clostridia bacterium]
MIRENLPNFSALFSTPPKAMAKVRGSAMYPNIEGDVWFYQTNFGVMVVADISGLPNATGNCNSPIFAFHIHAGANCTGNSQEPFLNAGTHYNPNNCPHPYHAGDLPPLFSANGNAFLAVLTNRFKIDEIIGKTVIIHDKVDDFVTQPAGNSGNKIACGQIISI